MFKVLLLEVQFFNWSYEWEWGLENTFMIKHDQEFMDYFDTIYDKFKQSPNWENLSKWDINLRTKYEITKDILKKVILKCQDNYLKKLPSISKSDWETRENVIYYYIDTTSHVQYRFSIHNLNLDSK